MNLLELANLVCGKIGKTDADSVSACKDYLRARHEMVYDAFLWRDSIGIFEASVAAEATTVILPWEVAKPIACWDSASGIPVDITSLASVAMINPKALTDNASLTKFVEVEAVGWLRSMGDDGGRLLFTNNGTEEVSVSVTGTRELSYPVTMDPANQAVAYTVASGGGLTYTDTFLTIERMTKTAVTGAAGAGILVTHIGVTGSPSFYWPPDSTEARWCRLRLINPPNDAMTLGVLGKRRLRQMLLDTDGPMVRGLDNCLLAFAQADMLERSRQYAKATEKRNEGTTMLGLAKEGEIHQSATESRLIPDVALDDGEEFDQW